MATFGQGINPQLGAINYAPYVQGVAQGSAALGRGIADLGQGVGQGIANYFKEQEINKQKIGTAMGIVSANPQVLQFLSPESKELIGPEGAFSKGKLDSKRINSVLAELSTIKSSLDAKAQMELKNRQVAASEAQASAAEAQARAAELAANYRAAPPPKWEVDYREAQTKLALAQALEANARATTAGAPKGLTELQQAQLDKLRSEAETSRLNAIKEKAKEDSRVASVKSGLAETIRNVDEAIILANKKTGGPVAGLPFIRDVGAIAGGKAKILNSKYDSIRAALKLEKLGEMKQLSSRGDSGLGQLSDKEGQALENSVSVLDVSLPEETQQENLLKIRTHLMRIANPVAQTGQQSNGGIRVWNPQTGRFE